MKVVSVAEMRAIEAATDAAGVSYAQMMEAAGKAVAEMITERVEIEGRRVLVLVGPGNNGGDGLVASQYLAEAGATVSVYLVQPRDEHDENYRRLMEWSAERNDGAEVTQPFLVNASDDQRGRVLHQLVLHTDILVDALLGTGANRPLEGPIADILSQVKRSLDERRKKADPNQTPVRGILFPMPRPAVSQPLIVAIDLPTGLNADTGEVDAHTLPADVMVTFAAPKIGQFRFPGAAVVGELLVADIGVPAGLPAVNEVALELADADMLHGWLPERPANANKGTFGKVIVVGGSANYTGAVYLAGISAYRIGAGLVTLAIPFPLQPALASLLPEATFLLLPHDLASINADALKVVTGKLDEYQAMLLGPGLGREKPTAEFIEGLIGTAPRSRKRSQLGFRTIDTKVEESSEEQRKLPPLVVDADGLNLLAEMEEWPKRLPPGTILTPHPGEMARLMKTDIETVQADRLEVARRQATEWGHIVVLKGAYTVIAAPDGQTILLPFANAGLARAGTGDVLSGTISGLLAQGVEPFRAAVLGSYLHGLAGELACEALGAASMIAGDVARYLPDAIQMLQEQE